MAQKAPRVSPLPAATFALATALGGEGTKNVPDMTIADAAAKSGLPLWDAERALHALLAEHRGHLRVTADGDLLFRFPHGLTKPWETRTKLSRAARFVGRGAMGLLRFVVRAWVAIVLIAYVLIFVALLIGLAFARGDDRGRGGDVGLSLGAFFFRILADALFWTFHPFSPFAVTYSRPSGSLFESSRPARGVSSVPEEPKTPFYEKVNRFFFGPEEPKEEPRAMEKKVLAEIRAKKGRIGLSDVMRVTGLRRAEADPLMARLMLEYSGNVSVSEEGGIIYTFTDIRKTADESSKDAPVAKPSEPFWSAKSDLAPFTGNSFGANFLIVLLNGFNLLMASWALSEGMTIDRIRLLFLGVPWQELPQTGTAWALGVVPLVFSIALFVLPLLRALYRPFKARRAARERGRKALLRAVLSDAGRRDGIPETDLALAWADAAGSTPDSKTLTREVAELGGDVDLDRTEDGIRYRFPELAAESEALLAEREAAAEEEARLGPVIFSSET